MQIHNIFPLTVCFDTLKISENERKKLIDHIKNLHKKSEPKHNPHSAWTGDVHGSEFLFNDLKFKNLTSLISLKIYEYLDLLSINTTMLDLYFQRSWATITNTNQNIKFHTHSQSHISFAYYLLKPAGTGGIVFKSDDPQNEICKNIFVKDKVEKNLLTKTTAYNANEAYIDLKQDSIVIFPSKTRHSTSPNKSNKIRISLSGDIVLMLKKSDGFEHLMPNFKHWKKLNKN